MQVFIDTNIYLAFYHLSSDDLEELKKLVVLVEQKKITLYVTDQVRQEFARNREVKIADALKKLKEQSPPLHFPQMCKDYKEYEILRAHYKEYETTLKELVAKLEADISQKKLKADEIITDLFAKATELEVSSDVVDRARLRIDVGNPPGKNGSLGDAISWELLLDKLQDKNDLHFITDDRDFASVLDEAKFKDFLLTEWQEVKESEIVFYRRLSAFFKSNFPEIKLASALAKELAIEQLVGSSNFATTHAAVAKLSGYTDFSDDQAQEILKAATTNNQVKWIAKDVDVKAFLTYLLGAHGGKIDEDLAIEGHEILKDDNPFEEIPEEEPPF